MVRSIIHSAFNPNTFRADIGLIKVYPAISFTKGNNKLEGATWIICLPKAGQEFKGIAIASGWGSEKENGTPSNVLKSVKLKILPSTSCRRYKNFQFTSQICAGYNEGGKDTCQVSLAHCIHLLMKNFISAYILYLQSRVTLVVH